MHRPPFGTIGPAAAPIASLEDEGEVPVAPRKRAAPHIVRSGKRTEDTGAGCRAKAAADLVRACAPGGDFMRVRLERSAAVWTERADLLERLEKKYQLRTGAERAAAAL
jgi:hypothetical protein